MPAKKPTAAEILTLITERAEALRKAGVLVVQVDNFSVQLVPWSEPPPPATAAVEEGPFIDPLEDPATYQNGRVPGFTRDEDSDLA
jgi:hypothetical protein